MIKDNILFIGLDFESSTGDHRTLAPIQLGITVNDCDFETLIGGWTWDEEQDYRWSEVSAKIHNIPQEKLVDAPSIFEADIRASAFMLDHIKGFQRMNRIAVGWNVGSFDRRIIYDWMPNLDKILSYRTIDLNTVCYFTADLLNGSYKQIKANIKARAAEELGTDNWHDALYDAKAGLLTYKYLLDMADLDVEKMIKQ